MNIVVLYKASMFDRSKCPDAVRYLGTHVAMKKPCGDWDYGFCSFFL